MKNLLETRKNAIAWYKTLTFEEKYFQVLKNKEKIAGYPDRNPDSLTGREIQILYESRI